jgi:rhamnogalacturonyl hydrolase YesR
MKKKSNPNLAIPIILSLFIASCNSKQEAMESLIKNRLDRSVHHYTLMAESLIDQPEKLPLTINAEGKLQTTSSGGWVSGFVPGSLWYLYQYSKNPKMLEYARNYTARIEKEKYNRGTHDLGFMMYCSFGNGYRLTGDTSYANSMLTGAESLAGRYNPLIGCIQSWNHNVKWQFPVIIDNMMNLEFLFWAARTSGNSRYRDICISHADKTIENHFRPDHSSYHVVSYDTLTGKVEKRNTHQGYADESTWARGQAWALYGFVLMYRETKDRKYLEQAKHIAAFILRHPTLPADKIPYWDFNDPGIPNTLRDASAGAVIASALIELSGYVDAASSKEYLNVAETQIRTLSSPEYFAENGSNGNFILKHSVGYLGGNIEVDAPLTYADYYYIEALLRYDDILNKK